MRSRGLTELSGNFGSLEITGNLNLNNNRLHRLPDLAGLVVGGSILLDHNALEELPDCWRDGQIQIGASLKQVENEEPRSPGGSFVAPMMEGEGDLYLNSNRLRGLPDSFCSLVIPGDLYLGENLLESLPAAFGEIGVGGPLNLRNNSLQAPTRSPA